jgi:ComF family protein
MSSDHFNARQRLAARLRQTWSRLLPGRRGDGIREKATSLGRAACGLLFPPRCLVCSADVPPEQPDLPLCAPCTDRLAPPDRIGCRRCGSAIPSVEAPPDHCPMCEQNRLWFDTVVTLGEYRDELRDMVVRMKRPIHESLSIAMGRLLAHRRAAELADFRPDLIVPIPMHWMRWLSRGMNSPTLVGDCLGRQLQAPVRRRLLLRHRNTPPQKNLKPRERFNNVRGAFRVRRGADLDGARVLLVDDILTTGATCSEAAKMLKQAGAAMVAVAIIARAQGRS